MKQFNSRWFAFFVLLNFVLVSCSSMRVADASDEAVTAVLNGLEIKIDPQTGGILSLEYPGPGTMLKENSSNASLIDLAYPIERFGALRLATRFSKNVIIKKTNSSVTITYDKLGASRDVFAQPGNVSAKVILQADPDGKSIIMTAQISNDSEVEVRQVIFPDFEGFLPFAGVDQTILKTAAFEKKVFHELRMNEDRLSTQFCQDSAYGAAQYESGGMFNSMWLRWLDFGGLNGGISLFPKRWGWGERASVRLHHDQTKEAMRLLFVHNTSIKAGEKWQSCEYILTPHKSGWAKGIEPYREWVHQNVKRKWPVPKHVREGLGFRTIWMSRGGFPEDPQDAAWTFRDYAKIAQENIDHGLSEMVIWGWHKSFELPIPDPYSHLGTKQDMQAAIATCKTMGVNVAPFVSLVQAGKDTAEKYGVTISANGWQQHVETIPAFQAPYLLLYQCGPIPLTNELWQKEVIESCFNLIDSGICSLSWDQFWTTEGGEMTKLAEKIRDYARQADPDSTFSAEELWNLEIDAEYLDYTWNWGGYQDCQAYTTTFRTPRRSCIVSTSPSTVKHAFLDNLYLNVFPRKPNSVNGSDWITNHAQLSQALKQCAKLRKQFLSYFTDGTLIGNCLLSEPCPDSHVTAFVLPDRVLLNVLNESSPREIKFACDLEPWLQSDSETYVVKAYDTHGKLLESSELRGKVWSGSTKPLETLEIAMFEIIANPEL